MTKISAYPEVSEATIEDLLIGTDVETQKQTKNFSIKSIVDLIEFPYLYQWIKSDESLSLAKRNGDVLYSILDQYTGQEMTLSKVTGTPVVDGIIYFQLEDEYFKRNYTDLNPYMFGAKGDGVNNDTIALQSSINFCKTSGDKLELKGNFRSNTITFGSGDIDIFTDCEIQAITDVDLIVVDGCRIKHTGNLTLRGINREGTSRGIVIKNGAKGTCFDKVYLSNFSLGIDYEALGNNNGIAWNFIECRELSKTYRAGYTKGAQVSNTTLYNIGEITTTEPLNTKTGFIVILNKSYPIVKKPNTTNVYYVGDFYSMPVWDGTNDKKLWHCTGGGILHQKHTDNGAIDYKTLNMVGLDGTSLTIQSFYGVTVSGGEIEGNLTNICVGGIYMNGINPETILSIRSTFSGIHTEGNIADQPIVYSGRKSNIVFEGCLMTSGIRVASAETGVKFHSWRGSDRISNVYSSTQNDFPTIQPINPDFKVFRDVSTSSDVTSLLLSDLVNDMEYMGDIRIAHAVTGEFSFLNIPAGATRVLNVSVGGIEVPNTINGGSSPVDINVVGVEGIDIYKVVFVLKGSNYTYYLENTDFVQKSGDTMTGDLTAPNIIAEEDIYGRYTRLTDVISGNFLNSGADATGSFLNSLTELRFLTGNGNFNPFKLSGVNAILPLTPTTSVDEYDIITRNTTTGVIEKMPISSLFLDSVNIGSITPLTTIPVTINVHGFAVEDGTYANCGDVVVPINSISFLSRIDGVWGISTTEFDFSGKVNVSDVVNTLVSTETTKPLSAAQGKLLNEKIELGLNYTLQETLVYKNYLNFDVATWVYESSVFSDWGMMCAPVQNFNRVKLKLRSWNNSNLINNLRLIIREGSSSGTILVSKLFNVNVPFNTITNVVLDLDTTIANSANSNLWISYLTDGYSGAYSVADDNTGTLYGINLDTTTEPANGGAGDLRFFAEFFNISLIVNTKEAVNDGIYEDLSTRYKLEDGINGGLLATEVLNTVNIMNTSLYSSGNTNTYNLETTVFSGFGQSLPAIQNFNSIKIKVRYWDITDVVTSVRVLVRAVDKDGAIITDQTIPFTKGLLEEQDILVMFANYPNTLNQPIWVEYTCDGKAGRVLGTTNSTIGETAKYRTVSMPGFIFADSAADDFGNQVFYTEIGNSTSITVASDEFVNTLETQLNLVTEASPDIVLPKTIYGVETIESNIYLQNAVVPAYGIDYRNFIIDIESSKGANYNKYWRLLPVIGDVGTTALTLRVKEKRTIINTKTIDLKIVAKSVGSGITRKVLLIGDSTIDNSNISTPLKTIFDSDVMDITLLGTRGSIGVKHEGRGGWTINNYYTNYAGNPFWDGIKFDIGYYLTNTSQTITDNDWVIFQLGINDVFGYSTLESVEAGVITMMAQLTSMMNNIQAYNANIRVGIALTIPPAASQDAFASNYGNAYDRETYVKTGLLTWQKKVLNDLDTPANITLKRYVVPIGMNLDTENNFPTEIVAVNSRNTDTVVRQSNGVHPAPSGYAQIADVYFSLIKNFV